MAFYRRNSSAERMARGLGWFSIGLGVAELVAGHRIARWMGMEDRAGLIRAYGAREVATGVGLLAMGDARPWMWGRIAGDALDIATLAAAHRDGNPRRENVATALGAVAAVTAFDVLCAAMLHREEAAAWTPDRDYTARDYSDRSGLPRPPGTMRGAAKDAPIPADMLTPEIMRFEPAMTS